MMKPKYELSNNIIKKDGHTMFKEDIVKDLIYYQRKLEQEKNKLNIASVNVEKSLKLIHKQNRVVELLNQENAELKEEVQKRISEREESNNILHAFYRNEITEDDVFKHVKIKLREAVDK